MTPPEDFVLFCRQQHGDCFHLASTTRLLIWHQQREFCFVPMSTTLGHIKMTKCTIDRRDKNLAQASTIAVVLERQHTALGEIVQVFWFGHLLPVLVIFHFFVFLSIVAHR